MASQTLQTIIAINAKVGNGFSEVGATLTELGSLVNGMSQQLIDFGKESVDVYRDYEKSMKDAEVALSTTYGQNTKELSTVMDGLNASATEWAASTVFHTNDVANAISEAAHAGWDYDQIMSGIPAAMQLAQAGSLDLSEAVNYIVKSTNAAGIGFEDLGGFIDLWTYAANSSASTVGEFGDAMLRMGSTMRFTENTEELMTLLAVTANAGSVGSEAGTLIRNSIMRLAAPTDNANEALAELGATSEELASMLDDDALAAANARLAAQGFSAYDQEGNLKPVLDIYRDLYVALGAINGGFENLDKNEDVINILHDVFQNRSLTEALTLVRGAAEGYDDLYDKMKNGDAEGYGEYAANTMMDSLDGRIETFGSKVERLKQLVGESISDELSDVLGSVGEIVDGISGIDSGALDALVGAAEVLAGAGPALLVAGAGFRLIGTLFTSGTLASGVAVLAMLAGAVAASRITEQNYADAFGNLEIDYGTITTAVSEVQTAFNEAYSEIQNYNTELQKSFDTFKTAGGDFKESLIGKMVTGAKLTQDDITNLNGLGKEMIDAVQQGIQSSADSEMASITKSMTEAGEGDITADPLWAQIVDVVNQDFEAEKEKARQLGVDFREALTEALRDKTVDPEELAGLQAYLDAMDEIMARQVAKQNYIEQQRILKKSQTLGLSGIREIGKMVGEERDREFVELTAQQASARFDLEYDYDQAIKEGRMIENTDGTQGKHRATEADKQAALARLDADQQTELYGMTAELNELLMRSISEVVTGSDVKDTWDSMQQLGQEFRENGGRLAQSDIDAYNQRTENGDNEYNAIAFLQEAVEMLEGREALQGYADYYTKGGNASAAQGYMDLISMYDIFGSGTGGQGLTAGYQETSGYSPTDVYQSVVDAIKEAGDTGFSTPEELASYITEQREAGITDDSVISAGLYNQLSEAASQMGMTISDYIVNAVSQGPQTPQTPTVVQSNTAGLTGMEAAQALQDQGATVSVDGDTQELSAKIESENGKQLLEYIDGDATNLSATITAEDGRTITTVVNGDVSQLQAAINSVKNQTVTVNIAGNKLFASGGRATSASIFGEAGAEWAIPEEHSENTANLLNAAREASGFTWPELLARYGGLNADATSKPTTLIYSPTINAADTSGVEDALLEDKDRLDRWYEEKQMRDRMEVFA